MENASKALIMAAGVLMAVLILSLAAYLIATFGSSAADIQKENEQKILSEFNSKFTVYEGRSDLTIYDVITAANYAKENNDKYNLDTSSAGIDSTFYINVKLDSDNNFETLSLDKQNEKLEENQASVTKNTYKCSQVKISSKTGRVYQVIFKKN